MSPKQLRELAHDNLVAAKKTMTDSIDLLYRIGGMFADINPKKLTTRQVEEHFRNAVQVLNKLAETQELSLPIFDALIAGASADLANEQ